MKKIIAWLLVLSLTAAISIGATLAYLTDTDEDVNVMTLGKVKIDQLEYERIDDETADEKAEVQEFHDNKPLYPAITDKDFDYTPGDTEVDWTQIGKDGYTTEIWDPSKINNELDKMVFVKNKGNYDAFVRTVFAFEAGNYETLDQFRQMVHMNLNETDWTWQWAQTPVTVGESAYFIATATYSKVLAPDALTEISLSQIALDKTATNADVEAFGETYQILVKTQAIQADGFENPVAALNDGFDVMLTNLGTVDAPVYEVNMAAIPFADDNPVEGVDLKSALHYLKGDTAGTMITDKVTSVTFGLNKDHEQIVNKYSGTLVDVEQDVPVYAYYVPNGANYDVYFLANDDIYAPKTCYALFYNGGAMSAMKNMDLSNLNTSRTTIMSRMFRNLPLKEIDVSGFDTSAVTDMDYMFYNCTALQTLDLSEWKVPALKTMYMMFGYNSKLQTVDFTGWQTGSLENMAYTFGVCSNLKTIPGIENFDVSDVTTMAGTFMSCSSLQSLDLTKWAPSKVKDMNGMFQDCKSMVELKADTWKLDSVTTTFCMFKSCASLKTVEATNWGMPNNTNLGAMFRECGNLETVKSTNWTIDAAQDMVCIFLQCYKLKNVDTTNWNTGNVTDMRNAFNACLALEYLNVSNWDVSKVTHFNSMFAGNGNNAKDMKIKALDLSKWNPTSAIHLNHMFYGCAQLTELDLSNWNMPNLYTTSHMFADCSNLERIDFTGWQTTGSWYCMDGMFNDCSKLQTLDLSSFNTSGVAEFSQIFEGCSALEKIIGLNQWNTSKGNVFDEMFNGASSLKEVNLSSFDTSSARYSNVLLNGEKNYHGYGKMFNGTTGLQKLILGEKFVFSGDGSIPATHYPQFPNPAAKEGYVAKWQNADTKQLYLASEIPGGVAATYVPNYEYTPKGATMNNALHYLNANPGSTKITANVTSVTFGLTENYAEIASTYTGVLADQEQEGPVYAYYVPNGSSNYDVYFLSDDVIYSPKDSSSLFKGMKALTTVDTTNYRFSGVEKMQEMFAECSALTTLDTTGWDTSKITDMTKLFYKCEVLQAVPGIGGWDMSNVETMFAMFARAYKLKTLDVSNWNTSSVTSLYAMFQMCFDLEYLDVADWNVSKVTDFSFLFKGTGNKGDMKINNLDISKWDTSSAKTFQCMFYGCAQITELDLSTWKTDNLEDMSHMFADCYKLAKISFAGWNTPKLNTIDALFNNCESLKSVDVSDLDTANVVEFSQAFEYCYSLEKIIGLDKWVTTSGQDFGEMFSSCGSLKELDLSSFDTTNAKDSYVNASNGDGNDRFHDFLSGCNALEKIILGKNFSFDGDGSFTKWTFVMPSSTKVNGWDGNWYDADGNAYAPSAILEETARTYYAVKPVNP